MTEAEWLDARHIEHDDIIDADGRPVGVGGSFPDLLLSPFFRGEIYLEFELDGQGRLARRLVRPEVKGF
jgi:hypothetical protein